MFVAGAGLKSDGHSGLTALLGCRPKVKSEDDYGFVCWVPCMRGPCLTVIIGLFVILGGSAMCTVGYYSEHFSSNSSFNGTHNVTVVNSTKQQTMHVLTFLGPVIMGFGCFGIVISCVVVCEARDQNIKAKWEKKNKRKEERDAAREAIYEAIMTKIKMSRLKVLTPKMKANEEEENNSMFLFKWRKNNNNTIEEQKKEGCGNRIHEDMDSYTVVNETGKSSEEVDEIPPQQPNGDIVFHSHGKNAKTTEIPERLSSIYAHKPDIERQSSIAEIQRNVQEITDTDEFPDLFQNKFIKRTNTEESLFMKDRSVTKTDIFLSEVDDNNDTEDEWGEFGNNTASDTPDGGNLQNKLTKNSNMSSIPESIHEESNKHHSNSSHQNIASPFEENNCSSFGINSNPVTNGDNNTSQDISGDKAEAQNCDKRDVSPDGNKSASFADHMTQTTPSDVSDYGSSNTSNNNSASDLRNGSNNSTCLKITSADRLSAESGESIGTARSTSHVILENKAKTESFQTRL